MNFKTRAIGALSALAVAGVFVAFAAPAANAVDTPAGSCTGSKSLVKITPALGDQTAPFVMTAALMSDLGTGVPAGTKIGGSCTGLLVPFNNPGGAIPGTVTPKAIAMKLAGIGSCAVDPGPAAVDATSANQFALTGKQTTTMSQLDGLGKAFQIQAYLTVKGFRPGDAISDVSVITGLVAKGPSVGATVGGQLYQDPISKFSPTSGAGPVPALPHPAGYTGYGLDIVAGNPIGCTDGIAGNVAMTQLQFGDGTSLIGSAGVTGLSFSYLGV